jgi:TRAP-type C4-dicarboxylate transport system permease small subunit
MSGTPEGPTPGDRIYIRAGGGVDIEPRRVLRFLIAACMLALLAITIVLTVSAATHNSRQTELQQHGVPVEVTVTQCVAFGSGIGQTVVGYSCRGAYALGGHPYNDVIAGIRGFHPVGQKLQAVAVPSDPGLLSLADAVAKKHSSWTSYIPPIIVGAVTVALALSLILWPKGRQPVETGPASDLVD